MSNIFVIKINQICFKTRYMRQPVKQEINCQWMEPDQPANKATMRIRTLLLYTLLSSLEYVDFTKKFTVHGGRGGGWGLCLGALPLYLLLYSLYSFYSLTYSNVSGRSLTSQSRGYDHFSSIFL